MSTNLTKLPPEPIRDSGAPQGVIWHQERRRRMRVRVHWPVYFWGGRLTNPLETVTRDLSSDGFSCLSRVPFLPGEILGCHIKIPEFRRQGPEQFRLLDCRVRVVWVDPVDRDGTFGIGCRLEAYRLISSGETTGLPGNPLLRQAGL